ncbi:MAG TPA: hypothetical protein VGF58_15770 [Burkholderiales bacterium]
MSTSERVAIVVVHGIADQKPGQTVREVARLLCVSEHGTLPYEQGEIQGVVVPVAKLEPGGGPLAEAAAPAPMVQAARKQERARRAPGAPSGFYQAHQAAVAETAAPAQVASTPEERTKDLGAALNDYLLGRLVLPEDEALYESTRVSLRRRRDHRALDVYEMYWADLSRLRKGGLRALSALYQLFFHLSTLAADVVDQVSLAARGGAGWRLLQRLHAWAAWLMKGPIALLQLAMLLMLAFGSAALVSTQLQGQLLAAAFGVAAVVLVALAGLAWLRDFSGGWRWVKLAVLLAAAAASVGVALFALVAEEWVPLLYFAACALAAVLLGAYLVERYSGVAQGVRVLGHLVVVAAVAALSIGGATLLAEATTQFEWMVVAALHVTEWLLAGELLAWALFVVVQVAALAAGWWLGRGGDGAAKASLHTARLGLIGSSSLFVVLSLVLWSVVSYVAGRALEKLPYHPILFGTGYRSAEIFLEERVQTLGAFFTPLVLALLLAFAAALLVLLPSLLEEIAPTPNLDARGVRQGAPEWARRLGGWLSAGVRALGTAARYLVPLGAIAGSLLYLAFVLRTLTLTLGIGGELTVWTVDVLDAFEGETLVAVGKWLAGGALTLAALGARFTQTFGRLRVAIDAVLDIDNYFADPPNRRPPRARIFSRFASLLAYLRAAGYARVVIVAHSQGTVISADLLRHLHAQGRLRDLVGAMRLSLVTVGSPLRDLYAERFPLLYRWMGAREKVFADAGPSASALGASEWVNACRSGDYVGRFIWTPSTDPALAGPKFDVAVVAPDGRVSAERSGDRSEFCLGAGAHTHYFSNDAVALAVEIERLAGGPAAN